MPEGPTRRSTPILLWRWQIVPGGYVYHAMQPITGPGDTTRWAAACAFQGTESVLQPDKTEWCLQCIRALSTCSSRRFGSG